MSILEARELVNAQKPVLLIIAHDNAQLVCSGVDGQSGPVHRSTVQDGFLLKIATRSESHPWIITPLILGCNAVPRSPATGATPVFEQSPLPGCLQGIEHRGSEAALTSCRIADRAIMSARIPPGRAGLLSRPWLSDHRPPGTDGSMGVMHAVELVFALGWAAFWIYWLVAAFSMKRGRIPWSRELRIRAIIIIVAVLLIRLGAFRSHSLNSNPWRAGLGLLLFVLGLGFAIWARLHIGRNWGSPMSQKTDPELVTSGPYRLVRHPIYSGILVAGIGTAVALSWLWLVAMVLAGIYFVYSATVEERYLTEQFPDTYPAYKHSTKMLLPLIL